MNKFPHTKEAFANLRQVTPKERNEYQSAAPDTELVDSYGENTARQKLYLYQRPAVTTPPFRESSTEEKEYYLIPDAKINLQCTPRLTNEQYVHFTLIEDIEFFNVTMYATDLTKLVHKSDFIRCYATKSYGTVETMVPLSDDWYPAESNHDNNCDEKTYAMSDITVRVNYHQDCWILKADAIKPYDSYHYFHRDDENNLIYSDHHCDYLHVEDARYPEDDPNTAYHVDHVYYNAHNDTYHTSSEAAYKNRIRDYHCTPQGTLYAKGTLNDPKDVLANYTIGFEVEKCYIDGNVDEGSPHDQEDLFAGWETDSSCGVEGITHIYGLNNYEVFANHVSSSYYVNEDTDRKCGGHINISDQTNRIRFWHIKNWVGLWYAMYRNRLNNEYAASNKKACPYIAKSGPKYQAIREKTLSGNQTLYELRLPSRVKSGHQLLRRFRLCQKWMKCLHAYANEDWSYTTAKYDDKYWGTPNWALENTKGVHKTTTGYKAKAEECAKETAELLSEVVSKPTALRMRYLIEQSKDELLESYGYAGSLIHVIQLAYAFQAYCEIPDTEGHDERLHEYIEAYI